MARVNVFSGVLGVTVCWAALSLLAGCDKRGAYERAVDAEIAKNPPKTPEEEVMAEVSRDLAKKVDKDVAAMSPAERSVFKSIVNTPPPKDPKADFYVLPAYNEESLYLGINYAALNRGNANRIGVVFGEGVYVEDVDFGSPAARAGLRSGDFLYTADGNKLTYRFGLGDALYVHSRGQNLYGQPVNLMFWRNGSWFNVTISPMPYPLPEGTQILKPFVDQKRKNQQNPHRHARRPWLGESPIMNG